MHPTGDAKPALSVCNTPVANVQVGRSDRGTRFQETALG